MAIQNDNTILKKADLKAYHERIAPMLGGTFMVSTNNSDYYSTDEKMIGIWIDGKPLYQKVVTYPITQTGWNAYTHNIQNIETAVKVEGYLVDSGAGIYSTGAASSATAETFLNNSVVSTYATADFNGYTVVATIQYTKSSDTAGSATTTPGAYDINFPNTWPANTEIYFGNGLYGYRATGTITGGARTEQVIAPLIPNTAAAKMVSYGGYVPYDNNGNYMQLGYYQTSGEYSAAIYKNANGFVLLAGSGETRNNAPYDIWVTYTK